MHHTSPASPEARPAPSQPARTRRGRRALAAALAALGIGGGLVAGSTPAQAASTVSVVRAEGADRYETARQAALLAFPGGADDVVMARGDLFPDALAGSRLAGLHDAPILLTTSDHLHPQTQAALAALHPTKVHLLGGPAAINDTVRDEIAALGYQVDRVGGSDRYQTAALIARSGAVGSTPGHGPTAIVASGANFPDALAGGPLAFDHGLPLLLVQPDGVPAVTVDALHDLGIDHVLLLGGPAAVSDGVRAAIEGLGITVERLAGADRYGTAKAIAFYEAGQLGWVLDELVLATGLDFPDAVVAGPLAGRHHATIVLTNDDLPGGSQAICADFAADFDSLLVVSSDTTAVPYSATQSCRILGEGNGAMAWLWADQPSTAAYTPGLAYQHTSAGTVSTVERLSKGRYVATLGQVARGDGTVQVTSYDTGRYCKVEEWAPNSASLSADLSITVQCRDLSGSPADGRFTLQYVQPGAGIGPVAYSWVSSPTAPGTYLDNYEYNSSGGVNSFDKLADGLFTVHFPGMLDGGTARVTAYGSSADRCTIVGWGPGAGGIDVDVACTASDGTHVNTPFVVLFGGSGIAPIGATRLAYLWASDPSASHVAHPVYSYNSAAGENSIVHAGVGDYTVKLPDLAGAGGNVQVVAYGDTSNVCDAYEWFPAGSDELVTVRCEDRFGNPVDQQFVLQFVA